MRDKPNKVLILGADGFIGRHLAFALKNNGFTPICVARNTAALAQMGFETVAADFTAPQSHRTDFWREHMRGVLHVVNAAGILTGSKTALQAVHVAAPKAIYAALPDQATSVLISAVGLSAKTDFSRFRLLGEETATQAKSPVVILRCGLVLGDTSYGGSSLIRALAVMPIIPIPGDGLQEFNPIHVEDLAQIVIAALRGEIGPQPIDVGGPETVTLTTMLASYRRWLGRPTGRVIHLPIWLASMGGALGDMLKLGPLSRTSLQQMQQSVLADTTALDLHDYLKPSGFHTFLFSRPAGTQDLWQARLYLLRPVVRLVLAMMWLASGLLGLFLDPATYLPYFDSLPLPETTLIAMAKAGGVVDLAIAVGLLANWRTGLLAWLQILMIAGYSIGLTLLAPSLWLLPLGGLLKNLPILVLLLVHRVLEQER